MHRRRTGRTSRHEGVPGIATRQYNRPVPDHERGLYETLITEALADQLGELDSRFEARKSELHEAEAADRLALHLSRVVERAIAFIDKSQRVERGTTLARQLVSLIVEATGADALTHERPISPAQLLRSVLGKLPDGRTEAIPEPLIPLLDTTLLTNAPGEPRVGNQVLAEIHSADRIDVVMAFIRRSGIAPMLDALRSHCQAGRTVRVLTTTYTGSTEARALDELRALGADVRVSYDETSTRLHAKAWLFHRASGFSTAYIGSSNLTHSAQVSGLEWNIRASSARNASVVEKVAAVFETYWNSGDFVPYDREQFLARSEAQGGRGPRIALSPIELRLEPFQERLLEQVELSRAQGRHRNLLVSATGTGKTVMAAIDYAQLRERLPRARLMFVAHREEILTQTLATFRQALRDHAFGELWVGRERPQLFEYVFASIQSLHASGMENLEPAHFDVVVVDEFHHAAAATYRALLDHVRPVELLGLTATPERADGLPVLDWFEGRIAAELRLWDAIDQHRLVPFAYYGIHDGIDLREIPWRRGRGYDVDSLSNLFTGNDAWARLVVKEVARRADDPARMRALGFCVSVEHARFMARVFRDAGISATAIWSDTADEERHQALKDLAERRVNVVFSVDLFNEGIDVPAVDTLLMLRPTDSPTLFLQQLGRGLRRHHSKTSCTVLDFIGHHRTEFRFDRRLRALLGGTRNDVAAEVDQGFPFLPAGCHMELDRVAREIVLASIRGAVPSRWSAKVEELRSIASGQGGVSLGDFLAESGLDLEDIYAGDKSWSDLCEQAGVPVQPSGPQEGSLRRACGRLLHIDDQGRIDAYRRLLESAVAPKPDALSASDRRLLRMIVASIVDKSVTKSTTLDEGCALLWAHPQVRAEIVALMDVLRERVTHMPLRLAGNPEVPLAVHARYTRIEILAAFDIGLGAKVAPWQTGVYWAKRANADLLAFTLDKTSGHFSPTTRYRDYAVSRDLIHWESQSVTRADSETGRRYQGHEELGSRIMLFARLRSDDRAFYFLGPATYVKHEAEMPMAVTWRLAHPLPGDLFASFAAAVA
jgi:superfamily II DNA or RNA helicase/HKD family nuclease